MCFDFIAQQHRKYSCTEQVAACLPRYAQMHVERDEEQAVLRKPRKRSAAGRASTATAPGPGRGQQQQRKRTSPSPPKHKSLSVPIIKRRKNKKTKKPVLPEAP